MTDLEQPNRQGVRFRKLCPRLRYRGGGRMHDCVGCCLHLNRLFSSRFACDIEAGNTNRTTGGCLHWWRSDGWRCGFDCRDERVYFDDEQIDLDRLEELLMARVDKEPKLVLIIEADRQVAMVGSWMCGVRLAAGVPSISLATGLRGEDAHQ